MRCWTFNDFTCPNSVPWKVRVLVDKLNAEMLSNSSSDLRRLYHLVLKKDFYNDNFTDKDDDNNWDLITSQATNFDQRTSTLQSVDLLGTSDDADAGPSQAAGSISTVESVTLRADDQDFPPPTLQELPVTPDDLVDEVFVTD